jgi:hypothetical protein
MGKEFWWKNKTDYYLLSTFELFTLALWSGNGHIYDIKANKKIAPQGSYTAFEYNGGSYAITERAIPTMITARAIGNILFGKNMRTIYERNKTLGGDTPSQFYNRVMRIVGFYNQFGVDKPFNGDFHITENILYQGLIFMEDFLENINNS